MIGKRFGKLGWPAKIALGLLLLFTLYQLWIFGHIVAWRWIDPTMSSFMQAHLDAMREKDPEAKLQHRWVPYREISNNLKRAVLASEDSAFMTHSGFDWEGIHNAYEKNLRKGKLVAGGSTITQQLAKNLFLSGSRSILRKGEEAIVTVMLEAMLPKRRILEIYLNVMECGDGVYGAEAGARHYFHVAAARLSPAQAARMAAMLPKPRYYDRHRSSRWLNQKTVTVLARMPQVAIPRN